MNIQPMGRNGSCFIAKERVKDEIIDNVIIQKGGISIQLKCKPYTAKCIQSILLECIKDIEFNKTPEATIC